MGYPHTSSGSLFDFYTLQKLMKDKGIQIPFKLFSRSYYFSYWMKMNGGHRHPRQVEKKTLKFPKTQQRGFAHWVVGIWDSKLAKTYRTSSMVYIGITLEFPVWSYWPLIQHWQSSVICQPGFCQIKVLSIHWSLLYILCLTFCNLVSDIKRLGAALLVLSILEL